METTDITIKTMPIGFIICFNENCLLAKKCLRRKVAEQSLGSTDVWRVVNHKKFKDRNCKYYFEEKKVNIAYGMTRSFDQVRAKDIAGIRKELIRFFGQNYYYKKRRAELPITPKEQAFISQLFKQYDYELEFDRIEKETLWF